MEIILKELPLLGYTQPPYTQRRMTEKEMKRDDIDSKKLYIVKYEGIWLIGRFSMQWYGWIFDPNLGSFHQQIDSLEAIYEVVEGLNQNGSGDTASFITTFI